MEKLAHAVSSLLQPNNLVRNYYSVGTAAVAEYGGFKIRFGDRVGVQVPPAVPTEPFAGAVNPIAMQLKLRGLIHGDRCSSGVS